MLWLGAGRLGAGGASIEPGAGNHRARIGKPGMSSNFCPCERVQVLALGEPGALLSYKVVSGMYGVAVGRRSPLPGSPSDRIRGPLPDDSRRGPRRGRPHQEATRGRSSTPIARLAAEVPAIP